MISGLCMWLLWAMGSSLQYTTNPPPLSTFQYTFPQDTILPPAPLACLSGVINLYTPVIGFGCDSSTLSVANNAGFAPGDKVVLIQMQVPQVDLSNTGAFGSLQNTLTIGNYAYNRVLSTTNNQIQLQFLLTQAYDLSGKVQLVRVPEFDSATVCNLSCQPWDGQTGGVLALDVKNELQLTANIDVSEKGFRGGVVEPNLIPWVFGEMQYTYPPLSTLAGQKGEGVAFIPANFSYGRGRAGNGGGGGNAHNGGGGGGGNAGNGGDGGLEISNLPNLPAPNTNGIGGQGYFALNAQKALMGGAGGAGHANDTLGSSGGAGGGIILLKAGILNANGYQILANGADVAGAPEHNDGQGGGGSGGTIVLEYNQLKGPLFCGLHGGFGGSNPYTPDFQIHGPGGGGGGGKLLLSQNTTGIVADFAGGLNGLTSQGLTNGALPGGYGSIMTQIQAPVDYEPAYPVSSNYGLSFQPPSCPGSQDGRIEIIQSSAKAWRINGNAWQNIPVFDSLGPGFYPIQLLFSGGCTLDTGITLLPPLPVLDTLVALMHETCLAAGSIEVVGVQGIAPFEYQMDNGAWQNNGLFTDLMPGSFAVLTKDARGCLTNHTYNILPHPVPPAPVLHAHAGCQGVGSIEIEQPLALSFSVNGGLPQNIPKFDGLKAGDYTVRLFFPDGCTFDTFIYLKTFPALRDTLFKLENATCSTAGQISVGALGGAPPFTFQMNNGNGQTTGNFTDLMPGAAAVLITDSLGCIFFDNFEIAAPIPLEGQITQISPVTCVEKGQITATGLVGSPPYLYQLDQTSWQAMGFFTQIDPGTHVLYIRDAGGCTDSVGFYLEAPKPVRDSLLFLKQPSCVEGGAVDVVGLEGTPPYTFQLNGSLSQANGLFENLPAGAYNLRVRDVGGCEDTLFCTLLAPPVLKDTLLALEAATCVEKGQVIITGVGGSLPYRYRLDSGNWQSSGVFLDLNPGTYSFAVQDSAFCITQRTVEILPPPIPQPPLIEVFPACQQMARITIQQSQALGFQLNEGPVQNTPVFSGLAPGWYALKLFFSGGCTLDTSAFVPEPPALQDTILHLQQLSCDVPLGAVTLQALGGTGPFQYQLAQGNWQANGTFNGLLEETYPFIIKDALGCVAMNTFSIFPYIPLAGQVDSIRGILCSRQEGQVSISVTGGKMPYWYQMNGKAPQNISNFTDLDAGWYTITVTDSEACVVQLEVNVPELGDTAYTQEVVRLYEGASYTLPDGRQTAKPGNYSYHYETVWGCDSTHVIVLEVFPRHIYVPNIFYPDSGGGNAIFTIYSDASLAAISRLAVYDRWGELLFDQREIVPNDEKNGWDGTFRGQAMETGVYVWFATLRFVDGVSWTLKGDITLIR